MAFAKWRPFCLGLNVLRKTWFQWDNYPSSRYYGLEFQAAKEVDEK